MSLYCRQVHDIDTRDDTSLYVCCVKMWVGIWLGDDELGVILLLVYMNDVVGSVAVCKLSVWLDYMCSDLLLYSDLAVVIMYR